MKAFISYSSQQLKMAQEIKDFLESIDIDSFLATDDVRTGSDWKERIFEELKKCELCIPLLSQEFKSSDWCSQELGIMHIQGKKFIPISLDDTKPYGFLNHIQTRFVNNYPHNPMVFAILSEGLMEHFSDGRGFIRLVNDSCSYRQSEELFAYMKPCFLRFNKDEINKIVMASLKNNQVLQARECCSEHIPKLLKLRKTDIEPQLYETIKSSVFSQGEL